MWLWLRGGRPVRDVPAAEVQGGLGLSEMQAVPGLRRGEPLPEGELLRHQRCRVRGLPAGVCQAFFVFFFPPRNYSVIFKQAFFLFPSKREGTPTLPRTVGERARLGISTVPGRFSVPVSCAVTGAGYK